ncbi:MAG: FAD-dependent oxidoreductase [Ilumatobacter sp.]|uniref:FAD-dependent oxidoreductase n=1 Tax=Ilumatobacter sp. TaxID=1967498 RepID=UPI003C777E02
MTSNEASTADTVDTAPMLRVLHVVESWPPVVSGYTSRSARLVASQNARPDLEPFVAVSSRQQMYRDNVRERRIAQRDGPLAGVEVNFAPVSAAERTVRKLRRFAVDGASFERWLNKELLRIRPDVVHVHWSSSIGYRSVRAGHQHGVPVVAEVRFDLAGAMNSQTFGGRLDIAEKPLRRHFERHLAEADAVIAASVSLGELLEQQTGVSPTIIENAAEDAGWPDADDVAPGDAALTWAAARPTWDSNAERLHSIYAETIRARHTPGRADGDRTVADRVRDHRLGSDAADRAQRIARVVASDDSEASSGNVPDGDGTSGRLVVIGAGPAGLTAALDAARRTGLRPVVLEASDSIGGLSRTVEFNGNLIDIGGHRFFSKSERVTNWWLDILPLAAGATWRPGDSADGPDPHVDDQVMLVRRRRSQILWHRNLFDYPLDLSFDLIRKLGLRRTARAGLSYLRAQLLPVSPVDNLEDFYINRFGRELYRTFFESYTEKVWGLPCDEISPDWGAQRVKGLSLWGALWHAIKPKRNSDAAQRDVATSLVERFLYPKYGPGQMWETAASKVLDHGGDVLTDMAVVGFDFEPMNSAAENDTPPRITAVRAVDRISGEKVTIEADHVVSTMPLSRLVEALDVAVSENAHEIADGLSYRDFITVGVLVDNLRLTEPDGGALLDNWLYIQEPDVLVGRLQIFNNWSPWMVADPTKSWVGLEYFCNTTDPMWSWSEDRLVRLAGQELASIGVIEPGGVLEGCAIKVKRAYPSYVGTYDRLDELQPELTRIKNLWCAGRNGQHRYNNQDHSMLASMMAIDQIADGVRRPDEIWSVNIDDDYHEGD